MPLEAAARQALWHKLHSALTFEPCEVLLQTLSRHRDRHRGSCSAASSFSPHLAFCVADRLEQSFEARRVIDRPRTAEARAKRSQFRFRDQTDGRDLSVGHFTLTNHRGSCLPLRPRAFVHGAAPMVPVWTTCPVTNSAYRSF